MQQFFYVNSIIYIKATVIFQQFQKFFSYFSLVIQPQKWLVNIKLYSFLDINLINLDFGLLSKLKNE